MVSSFGNVDSDGDIMLDAWEVQYGLQVAVDDGGEDADGDGISNQGEFICGSVPTDESSQFILDRRALVADHASFQVGVTHADPHRGLFGDHFGVILGRQVHGGSQVLSPNIGDGLLQGSIQDERRGYCSGDAERQQCVMAG